MARSNRHVDLPSVLVHNVDKRIVGKLHTLFNNILWPLHGFNYQEPYLWDHFHIDTRRSAIGLLGNSVDRLSIDELVRLDDRLNRVLAPTGRGRKRRSRQPASRKMIIIHHR